MAGGQKEILVLGSSVCLGEGARKPGQGGWAARLGARVQKEGFEVRRRGVSGTNVAYWLDAVEREDLSSASIIIMSLSLGNEGLAYYRSLQDIEKVKQHYLSGLRSISESLRARARPGARLVLGGPYPNTNYNDDHLTALQEILACLRSWEHVDHVIDFLQPVVHDGSGHWVAEAARDPGHPNDLGHKLMYQCVDVAALLGPSVDALPGPPGQELPAARLQSTHDGKPLVYRYVGQRSGGMKDAAVGWFELEESAWTWKSFNGDPARAETWSERNTWRSLHLEGREVLSESGSLVATLQCDDTGLVVSVAFGSCVWQLHDPLGVEHGSTGFSYVLSPESADAAKAQGWFKKDQSGKLSWRTRDGDTVDGLEICDDSCVTRGDGVTANLELDDDGIATVVMWGEQRWHLLKPRRDNGASPQTSPLRRLFAPFQRAKIGQDGRYVSDRCCACLTS